MANKSNIPFYTERELEELGKDKIKYPYSDNDAEYVLKSHQYQLTPQYFIERGRNLEKEVLGTNPDKVKHFLSYLRIKVYNRIYTHSKSSQPQLNYMIAKRGLYGYTMEEYRHAFLEAMFLEGCYLLDNGDISSVSAVDLDTMQNMSIDVVRNQDRDFHKDVLGLLTELGLQFRGKYRFIPQGEDW